MNITINVTAEQLACIRQGLMCAAAVSTEHRHHEQSKMFHDVCNGLPDPYFPAKPELPLRDTTDPITGEPWLVTTVHHPDGTYYLCRACRVKHGSKVDAEDCMHPEDQRARNEIERLEREKPENWEYTVHALKSHYLA